MQWLLVFRSFKEITEWKRGFLNETEFNIEEAGKNSFRMEPLFGFMRKTTLLLLFFFIYSTKYEKGKEPKRTTPVGFSPRLLDGIPSTGCSLITNALWWKCDVPTETKIHLNVHKWYHTKLAFWPSILSWSSSFGQYRIRSCFSFPKFLGVFVCIFDNTRWPAAFENDLINWTTWLITLICRQTPVIEIFHDVIHQQVISIKIFYIYNWREEKLL